MNASLFPDPSGWQEGQDHIIGFGPYLLNTADRRLVRGGQNVRIGGRAIDILIALCAHAGSVVAKEDLLREVWPHQQADEGSLRVHISELRKVLGEGSGGNRYIINVPGKGYSFVGGIAPTQSVEDGRIPPTAEHPRGQREAQYVRPPLLLTRPIGRASEIERILDEVRQTRFVTIVGTGGVGKTTTALAVSEMLRSDYDDEVVFVDLAMVSDNHFAQSTFATALGIPVRDERELTSIIKAIAGKRLLLVIDNCEHVVEAVAEIVHKIHALAPQVSIIATAREPLHTSGERVHRLPPLMFPPEGDLALGEIEKYTSVQLFLERARSLDNEFELTEGNATAIAGICRSLDGLALAIEFAASRVAVLGTDAMAGYFGEQLDMLDRGRRTASPRHQTLRLTLDWSYDLLSTEERDILRGLSVFAGSFSLPAAQIVLKPLGFVASEVANCIADLVDKSLVSLESADEHMRFRLLNTTREYVGEKLAEFEGIGELRRSHAGFLLGFLKDRRERAPEQSLAPVRYELENIRAALVWAYGPSGDLDIGIPLAVAAAPLFWDLGLLLECARWSSIALERLTDDRKGGLDELELRVNSSLALLFTRGNDHEVSDEIRNALALARSLQEMDVKERVLSGLFAFHLRGGDVAQMTTTATDAVALANRRGVPYNGASDSMMSMAHAFSGSLDAALPHAERALNVLELSRPINLLRTGVDHRMWSANVLAQCLWMKGEFSRATDFVADALAEARTSGHPVLEAMALIWMIPVSFWAGDTHLARERVDRLSDCAARGALIPFRLAADAHRAVIELREGNVGDAIGGLKEAVEKLECFNSRMLQFVFSSYLADAYSANGDHRLARQTVDHALHLAELNGSSLYTSELTRKKAVLSFRETGTPEILGSGLDNALQLARLQRNHTSEIRILSDMVTYSHMLQASPSLPLDDLDVALRRVDIKSGVPDVLRACALLSARTGTGLHAGNR